MYHGYANPHEMDIEDVRKIGQCCATLMLQEFRKAWNVIGR